MKGFTRYYRDPVFRAEVDEQFQLAKNVSQPGIWITYAIHDPTRTDHILGSQNGLIVYVGQSKQFAIRVKDRMATAGRARKRPTDHIDGLLYDIMSRGPAPRWSILEEVNSAIDSFASETNWTNDLRSKGYPLVNQWAEHRLGTIKVDRYGVPTKRLWQITAADAIGSNIGVIVSDPADGRDVEFDLSALPPNTRIQKIKAHAQSRGCNARILVR